MAWVCLSSPLRKRSSAARWSPVAAGEITAVSSRRRSRDVLPVPRAPTTWTDLSDETRERAETHHEIERGWRTVPALGATRRRASAGRAAQVLERRGVGRCVKRRDCAVPRDGSLGEMT